jgi:hypothetical protein
MQRLLVFVFVFSLLQSSGLATLASAGEPAFHIASFVIEPTAPRAGDTVTVHLTVVDARDQPVTGLTGHTQVRPVMNTVDEDTVAEVAGLAETGPGEYVVTVPLNTPGEWRIVVTLTDAVRTLEQATTIVVAPRLAPPPPRPAPRGGPHRDSIPHPPVRPPWCSAAVPGSPHCASILPPEVSCVSSAIPQ